MKLGIGDKQFQGSKKKARKKAFQDREKARELKRKKLESYTSVRPSREQTLEEMAYELGIRLK